MFKATVIGSVALCLALLAPTQGAANPIPLPPEGNITPYADVAGTDQIIQTPVGVVDIYIFLDWYDYNTPYETAVMFAAPKPKCFDAELVGEKVYFELAIGNTQTGLAIAFAECRVPRILLVKLTYQAVGSSACCHYWVCPAPEAPSGYIELVDCADHKFLGIGGALVLNTTTYPCQDSNTTPCAQVAPVEASTWGKVKSLYAQ